MSVTNLGDNDLRIAAHGKTEQKKDYALNERNFPAQKVVCHFLVSRNFDFLTKM
jgi:hypothetical protein